MTTTTIDGAPTDAAVTGMAATGAAAPLDGDLAGGGGLRAPARGAGGRFAGGNAGRPFGSRNRASKRVARAILRDFEAHQGELLPRMRRWFLPQYLTLVARLLPRVDESGGTEVDAPDAAETAALIAELRAALDRVEAGQGGLAELESALLGEGRHNSGAVVIGG
ncbi:MAG TPA: hypothetical protein VGG29_16315 [Caulobacteraceae bacterium]|jgi:hypothetical protein